MDISILYGGDFVGQPAIDLVYTSLQLEPGLLAVLGRQKRDLEHLHASTQVSIEFVRQLCCERNAAKGFFVSFEYSQDALTASTAFSEDRRSGSRHPPLRKI
jgi:hypothetical protein